MFIPFKSRIRDFIRWQIKAELAENNKALAEAVKSALPPTAESGSIPAEESKLHTRLNELTDEIQKLKAGQPKTPLQLGFFTENYGPYFESRSFQNTKLLINRHEALPYMPKNAVTAEIGVAFGEFTDKILEIMSPKEHHMIDYYLMDDFWNRGLLKRAGKSHFDYIRDKYADRPEVKIDKGYSHEVMEKFPDNYFDYVYLDGAHDYGSVKKDIAVSIRKVKDGGILQFNDFTFFSVQGGYEFGVYRAVRELLAGSGHEVLYYCLHDSKMDDIVVRLHKDNGK